MQAKGDGSGSALKQIPAGVWILGFVSLSMDISSERIGAWYWLELRSTMVADTAPADLRSTAYGFFNLVSGMAMLLASVVAGLLWDRLGASATFYAGATFCMIAWVGLAWPPEADHC